jgi:hypothetical protein
VRSVVSALKMLMGLCIWPWPHNILSGLNAAHMLGPVSGVSWFSRPTRSAGVWTRLGVTRADFCIAHLQLKTPFALGFVDEIWRRQTWTQPFTHH